VSVSTWNKDSKVLTSFFCTDHLSAHFGLTPNECLNCGKSFSGSSIKRHKDTCKGSEWSGKKWLVLICLRLFILLFSHRLRSYMHTPHPPLCLDSSKYINQCLHPDIGFANCNNACEGYQAAYESSQFWSATRDVQCHLEMPKVRCSVDADWRWQNKTQSSEMSNNLISLQNLLIYPAIWTYQDSDFMMVTMVHVSYYGISTWQELHGCAGGMKNHICRLSGFPVQVQAYFGGNMAYYYLYYLQVFE
jgi:hypothetical protein